MPTIIRGVKSKEEIVMPDLRYCVRYKEKTYCWDAERKRLVEVVVRDVPLTPEVTDVIGKIVSLMAGQRDPAGTS
jgi:hypothetical protein